MHDACNNAKFLSSFSLDCLERAKQTFVTTQNFVLGFHNTTTALIMFCSLECIKCHSNNFSESGNTASIKTTYKNSLSHDTDIGCL